MSAKSTLDNCMRGPSLQIAEPAANFRVSHCSTLDALANARVACEIERRETGIGLVPDLSRHLVAPVGVLEPQLVLGAVLDEPIGARVSQAVAEGEVQPPAGFVDEVVHIGLPAAVVIACKQHTS